MSEDRDGASGGGDQARRAQVLQGGGRAAGNTRRRVRAQQRGEGQWSVQESRELKSGARIEARAVCRHGAERAPEVHGVHGAWQEQGRVQAVESCGQGRWVLLWGFAGRGESGRELRVGGDRGQRGRAEPA